MPIANTSQLGLARLGLLQLARITATASSAEGAHTSQLGVAQLGLIQLGLVSSDPAPTPPSAAAPWGWYVPLSEAAPAKIEVISY